MHGAARIALFRGAILLSDACRFSPTRVDIGMSLTLVTTTHARPHSRSSSIHCLAEKDNG